jgi:hypothetical protein
VLILVIYTSSPFQVKAWGEHVYEWLSLNTLCIMMQMIRAFQGPIQQFHLYKGKKDRKRGALNMIEKEEDRDELCRTSH